MTRKILIGIGVLVAAVVGIGADIFTTLDDQTEAKVVDVVADFRADAGPDLPARAGLPKLLRMPSASDAATDTWGGEFTAGDLKLSVTSRRLPNESITVGATAVPVQVVESVQAITGEYTGDRTETFWYSPKLGVIVRYKIDSSLKGPTDLDFNADQLLQSLEPEV